MGELDWIPSNVPIWTHTVLLGIILFYSVGQPFRRGFNCDDDSIRYPFRNNTISGSSNYLYSTLIPVATVSFLFPFSPTTKGLLLLCAVCRQRVLPRALSLFRSPGGPYSLASFLAVLWLAGVLTVSSTWFRRHNLTVPYRHCQVQHWPSASPLY